MKEVKKWCDVHIYESGKRRAAEFCRLSVEILWTSSKTRVAVVVFKAKAKYEPSRYKKPLRVLMVAAVALFVASNVACAVVIRVHQNLYKSVPMYLLYMRVAINDSLFMMLGIVLAVCIFRVAKMSSSSLVLEAKGTSVCQAVVVSTLIVLLFTSRAVYNFITISPLLKKELPDFGYDWVNVSDQADTVKNLSQSFAYISFGIVLFIWEVLPITVVVLFFRVKRQQTAAALTDFSSGSYGSKVFFFDNPRRYDSEDDLSRVGTRSPLTSGYHSINYSSSSRGTPRGTPIMPTGSFPGSISGSSSRTDYGAIVRSGNLTNVSRSPLHTSVLIPPPRSASVTLPPGVAMNSPSEALMASRHHAVMALPENAIINPPTRAILSAPTLQRLPIHVYSS
ncbi:hypothetical protein C0Q70_14406 [Pomacea canaliculata]|uniref:Uncharacterized protein n=1 Tax=Pomacea canaliculata TaxID=400727 RepID=A0A2T7NZW7_POMCA|nr:hypothetical protein C0Q70_14406 [Pomacea canaliculata]